VLRRLVSFVTVLAVSVSVCAAPLKEVENETQTLINSLISDTESVRTALISYKQSQDFLKSIVTDANGHLVSFKLAGKTITPIYVAGKFSGYDDGTNRVMMRAVRVDGSSEPVAVATIGPAGEVKNVVKLDQLGAFFPDSAKVLAAEFQIDSRPLVAVETEASDYQKMLQAANGVAAFRPDHSKAKDPLAICGLTCDMNRDSANAMCDRDFDMILVGLGGGTAVATLVAQMLGFVVVGATSVMVGFIAADKKYICKNDAAKSWLNCQISCG
jgi:hypothetical protein